MMPVPKTYTQTPCAKKRYYARIAGSRFCHEDGNETHFNYGFADISIKEHQEELDKIIGKNPNIYVPEKLPDPLPQVQQNAVSELDLRKVDAELSKLPGKTAQEIGTVDATAGLPTDINASSIDAELQAAVFSNPAKVVGPGAARGAIQPINVANLPVSPVAPSHS